MSILLLVGDRNLTRDAQNLQWTSVDPGGCETASFTLADSTTVPTPGERVRIFEGLTCIWDGRVEEPGDDFDDKAAPGQVSAVGAGAILKDGRVSVVFIDRDLNRWQPASRQRQINNIGANYTPYGPSVQPDTTTGNPSLETAFDEGGGWAADSRPAVEAWYDAGDGNEIGALRATWTKGDNILQTDTEWEWQAQS